MAQIRVERERRISPWVWLIAAVVLVVAAVLLLAWAGYIELPVRMGAAAEPGTIMTAAAAALKGGT